MKSTIEPPIRQFNALGVTHDEAQQIAHRLKEKRAQNKLLSLEQIAEELRIKVSFLRTIESGEWDSLPYCSIGRGFVRIYAKKLGVPIPEFDKFFQSTEAESLQPVQTNMDSIVSLMRQKSLENSAYKRFMYRIKERLLSLGLFKTSIPLTAPTQETSHKTAEGSKKTWMLVSLFGFFAIGVGIGISTYLLRQNDSMDIQVSEQSIQADSVPTLNTDTQISSAPVSTFSPMPIQNMSIQIFREDNDKSESDVVRTVK